MKVSDEYIIHIDQEIEDREKRWLVSPGWHAVEILAISDIYPSRQGKDMFRVDFISQGSNPTRAFFLPGDKVSRGTLAIFLKALGAGERVNMLDFLDNRSACIGRRLDAYFTQYKDKEDRLRNGITNYRAILVEPDKDVEDVGEELPF